MKLKYFFSLLLLFISVNYSFSQIYDITPGKITICASTPIPDGVTASTQSYIDLIDCGFNSGMAQGSVDYFKQQFNLIGNLDFKYLIQSTDLFTDKRSIYIKEFQNDRHFGGWKFKDEPTFSSLDELQSQYRTMVKADPHNLVYLNFVGVVDKTFTGNLTNFYDYLELLQNKFAPEVWSYDYYPILSKNGKLIIEYDQFYSDLEDFSAISKKTGKPFWAYCESMAYKASSYSRPAATEAYLRWEAFSALAYGAQGIVYWTYGLRNSNPVENYTSALVDLKGKKSKAWYAAKKVNSDIKRFNDFFYHCNVKEVRHTGDRIYKGTKKLSGQFGPFNMVRSQEAGVMVSIIENNGKEYIVIVSRDVLKKQKISLELKPNTAITDLTPSTPKTYNWRKDVNLTLDKGGYVIFSID